uniref:IGF-like family receptor 1 n=1 Tax=Seriola lalandi dorsalis TaxID=1841481 RepID=A0A3B4XR19_SERLL
MHSIKCLDVKTRWDKRVAKCVPCPLKPGYEITPNCGFDDNGGRHEVPHKKCKVNTFNDGSWFYCRPCTVCQPYAVLKPCSQTTDTEYAEMISTTLNRQSIETASSSLLCKLSIHLYYKTTFLQSKFNNLTITFFLFFAGAVPLAVLISIILVVSSAFMIYMKRKRDKIRPFNTHHLSSVGSEILLAPLQTVLDNLDVLEQLVILLDPDSPTVKNTKHLASHCSFSSTWITYSYSMKDSKSPLKALLEGVTSRYPDWTVGHLVKLLRQMQRNDAIAVLKKNSRPKV